MCLTSSTGLCCYKFSNIFYSDLVGCQDGSVRLFEWTHPQHISVARQSGSFPKVTRVLFNSQGNKVGPIRYDCAVN